MNTDILIHEKTKIVEVMKVLDASAKQFVVVVNTKNQLQGTVTDGDIRRGLLKGFPLSTVVSEVMNKEPIYALAGQSNRHYRGIMNQNRVQQLPIVNEVKEVKDILFIREMNKVRSKENLVILMAGGLGTRLRPLTNETPKPMLPIGGKPILENIIMHFKSYGFVNFALSVNYKKDVIKNYFQDGSAYGVNITYLEEDEKLGTAGALSLLSQKIDKPFFVMNGDLLTNVNFEHLLEFHIKHQASATMCVRDYEYKVPYGVIEVEEHKLVSIVEKPINKHFVNAGIYVLQPNVLGTIPKNSYYDMPDLFNQLMCNNEEVSVFPIREYWMDIGQIEDYEMANKDYNEGYK
ncbi:nucleotidyltransferase family protein [Lysinibacillus fusiformis]